MQRQCVIPWPDAGHVVFAQTVAEQRRAGYSLELAPQREFFDKLPRTRIEFDPCVGVRQIAHLVLEQPPLVVTPNARDVVFDQQLDRMIRIARPVDDVADRADQIETPRLEESQRGLQTVVFAMNVAENSDAA